MSDEIATPAPAPPTSAALAPEDATHLTSAKPTAPAPIVEPQTITAPQPEPPLPDADADRRAQLLEAAASADELRQQKAIAVILAALLVLVAVQIGIARWPVGGIDIERAAEHRYDLKLDINFANEMELLHLPEIGPKLAAQIVKYRAEHGPFRSIADIERVPNIGPKRAQAIAPYLRWPEVQSPPATQGP